MLLNVQPTIVQLWRLVARRALQPKTIQLKCDYVMRRALTVS